MIVVSDTTPLISLMKIGQLELINKLFGEIQIPDAVFDELVLNPRFVSESKQIRESNSSVNPAIFRRRRILPQLQSFLRFGYTGIGHLFWLRRF